MVMLACSHAIIKHKARGFKPREQVVWRGPLTAKCCVRALLHQANQLLTHMWAHSLSSLPGNSPA